MSSYRIFNLDSVNRLRTSKFVRCIAWLAPLDLKQLHFSTCRSSTLQCLFVVGKAIVPGGLFMIPRVPNRVQFRTFGISNPASRQLPLFGLYNSRVRDRLALGSDWWKNYCRRELREGSSFMELRVPKFLRDERRSYRASGETLHTLRCLVCSIGAVLSR